MAGDDPRLGSLIRRGEDGDIVILGYPHDEGVRRNGGRVGAKDGPTCFRKHLAKIGTTVNPEYNIDLNTLSVTDAGDIDPSLSLEGANSALEEKVSELTARAAAVFVIGGGNDQSYPNASGLMSNLDYGSKLGVINIDAHLDVRPLVEGSKRHSGSPFRLLLEDRRFVNGGFVEFAAQGAVCSAAHANYVKSKGQRICWLKDLREGPEKIGKQFARTIDSLGDTLFVSFDLDAVSSADAPGVSATAAIGLTGQEACDIAFEAGRNPKVRLFDLSEYNPNIEDHRTGRLVAHMFYFFLLGFATRTN